MPRNLAMDFVQGASNAAASNVSGPVDLLAFALRKMGFPVPEDPVLGAKWLADRGITVQPQNRVAGMLGETAGLVAPIAAAAKAPQIAAGMLQAGENLAAPRTLNPQLGAIVYHGSPHKFDAFDSSKIGTGEGAQAYGHGLYLAESPAVAGQYKEALSSPALSVRNRDVRTTAGTAMDTAKAWLESVYERGFFNSKTANAFDQAIRDVQGAPVPNKQDVLDALQRLKASGATMSPGGALYKVDLPDEKIARMLDWDVPLSNQSPAVREALARAGVVNLDAPFVSGLRGGELYKRARNGAPAKLPLRQVDDEIFAAQRLREAGIPGVRYLDGGSRGAGAGTSNYVVFPGEEGALKILERNGQRLSDLGKK
jgi:hypothetical protein